MPELSSTDGEVFFPRARVMWAQGGLKEPTTDAVEEIPWLLSINVHKTKHSTISSFQCTFALFGQEDASYAFWGNIDSMIVRVEIAFDQATDNGRVLFRDWTPLIHGIVQNIKQDVTRGIVTIQGLEIPAVFAATHIINAYTTPNVKETLTQIIEAHGFVADVDGALDVTHGIERLDEKAYQSLGMASREINERDLIAKLKNDFDIEIWLDKDGKTIHAIINPDAPNTWVINCPTPTFLDGAARHHPSNFTKLIFDHNLILAQAGGANQMVGTCLNTQNKECTVIRYPDNATVGPNATLVMMPFDGHSVEDAHTHAKGHLLNYIGREWTVEWHTSDPRIIDFDVNDLVVVQGTNSANDGPYALDYIEFSLDTRGGFRSVFHGIIGRDIGGEAGATDGSS